MTFEARLLDYLGYPGRENTRSDLLAAFFATDANARASWLAGLGIASPVDNAAVHVSRERQLDGRQNRVDLLLEWPGHVVAIESKVKSFNTPGQLLRYARGLREQWPDDRLHLVYLTEAGNAADVWEQDQLQQRFDVMPKSTAWDSPILLDALADSAVDGDLRGSSFAVEWRKRAVRRRAEITDAERTYERGAMHEWWQAESSSSAGLVGRGIAAIAKSFVADHDSGLEILMYPNPGDHGDIQCDIGKPEWCHRLGRLSLPDHADAANAFRLQNAFGDMWVRTTLRLRIRARRGEVLEFGVGTDIYPYVHHLKNKIDRKELQRWVKADSGFSQALDRLEQSRRLFFRLLPKSLGPDHAVIGGRLPQAWRGHWCKLWTPIPTPWPLGDHQSRSSMLRDLLLDDKTIRNIDEAWREVGAQLRGATNDDTATG